MLKKKQCIRPDLNQQPLYYKHDTFINAPEARGTGAEDLVYRSWVQNLDAFLLEGVF